MAFSVTNIQANTNTTGATLTATYTGSNVTGVLVFVAVTEMSATVGGSLADTRGNAYTEIQNAFLNNSTTQGFCDTYYAKNASLNTNDVITFTKQTSGDKAAISACYVTGADTSAPLDTAVTAKATGSSTTPSVTGGTAGISGELNIGIVAISTQTGTTSGFAQATGWAAPPNSAESATTGFDDLDGGNQVNSGTAGLTYNPTCSTHPWACFICAFKAAAAAVQQRLMLMGCGS